jgi:hypothetical protein
MLKLVEANKTEELKQWNGKLGMWKGWGAKMKQLDVL